MAPQGSIPTQQLQLQEPPLIEERQRLALFNYTQNPKPFKIFHLIESCNTCIEY
jgi:hypothetical protein